MTMESSPRGAGRVWLDDERPMPPGFDVHVRTAREAIDAIVAGAAGISLDHDLGPAEAGSGYDVAAWLEEAAWNRMRGAGGIGRLEVRVHSANPVGAASMRSAIANAERFWSVAEGMVSSEADSATRGPVAR